MARSSSAKKKPKRRKPHSLPRNKRARSHDSQQQRRDLIGLALSGAAVFFAFVFYFGWNGGGLGEALEEALVLALGRAAYLAPVALGMIGFALMFGSVIERKPARPRGAGIFAIGVLLALAAGTFGLGGDVERHDFFEPAYYKVHGGFAGESINWAVASLIQSFGTHLTAIVLTLSGGLLMAGTSVAAAVGRIGAAFRRLTGRSRNEDAATPAARKAAVFPPEVDGLEPVVRATHVEAFPLDGAFRPALGGEEELHKINDLRETTAEQEAIDPVDDPDVTVALPAAQKAAETDGPVVVVADDVDYRLPDPRMLTRSRESNRPDIANQEKVAKQLLEALGHFGIDAKLIGAVAGPHITRYELQLSPGVKMAKVAQLKDDLAYALASTEIRILAPIPGKQAVGVEVPNLKRRIVHLGDIFQELPDDWSPLSVWLGKDIAGKAIGTDLAKMPHILVAGTTGAGKSGCINAMLSSILLHATPNECKLVLIDPKQVELNHYDDVPHLLTPVVTSPRMAANVMANLIREMEQRYTLMGSMRVRNIKELNVKLPAEGKQPLPYILCVIDELADLMMVAPSEVEDAIIRLAQKSRAVGIHLVLATQRPSADIITGMIKANVPSRIAFAVSSQTDSRVVLDQNGAETLLGQGDMLFSPIGSSRLQRIQGAYITEEEIAQITEFWRSQGEPEFQEELLKEHESLAERSAGELDPDADDLLAEAVTLVVQMGTASTSMIQRRLRVGYTRAGRLIDMLERRGVISGYEGSKARQVLIAEADLPRILGHLAEREPLPTAEPQSQ